MNAMLQRALLVLMAIVLLAGTSPVMADAETTGSPDASDTQMVSLFDGKTLTGWHKPFTWGEASVENGEIVLKADKKFFLVSDKTYGDFTLTAELFVTDPPSRRSVLTYSGGEK